MKTVGGDFEGVGKDGTRVQVCGVICKEMAQSVLLYGSESWVVTGAMLKVLEGFTIRRIDGSQV